VLRSLTAARNDIFVPGVKLLEIKGYSSRSNINVSMKKLKSRGKQSHLARHDNLPGLGKLPECSGEILAHLTSCR
jgi:hypothetical protein